MALDFPSNPTNGQVYDNFIYDAAKGTWKSVSSGASPNYVTNAVITATASTSATVPLTVNGAVSQSANLQEWKNSNGVIRASVDPDGKLFANGGLKTLYIGNNTDTGVARIDMDASGTLVSTNTGSTIGLRVRNTKAGFTSDLQQWQNESGSALSRIDASGRVHLPNQPSFRAYYHELGSNPNGTLINFNVIEHNIGGHFNASNGRFTAPISGRYLMSFHAFRQDGQSGNWVVQYLVNGSIRQSRSYDDSDSSTAYGPNTAIVDIFSLSAGDYVNVNVQNGNVHGNDNCFFSGHFLG